MMIFTQSQSITLYHFFFDDHGQPGWLRFIDDIIPAGASRRYWINALDISELPVGQQNFLLLKFGTMSPVGNLRIKESVPEWNKFASTKTFTVADVIDRAADFLIMPRKRRGGGWCNRCWR